MFSWRRFYFGVFVTLNLDTLDIEYIAQHTQPSHMVACKHHLMMRASIFQPVVH